jgi:glycosyltransferase involved in cell wall biosynthesis
MAVRNGAAFLAEAIESVRAQTLRELELIVVDDGSTDGTPEILARFERQDPRIRVLREPGAGVSRARNAGCAEARGRYLAILDADDVALPHRLADQAVFLDTHPDVSVVGGGGILTDEHGAELGTAAYPADPAEARRLLESGASPLIQSAATMRPEVFRAAGGYRPVMEVAQDYELWLRIAAVGRISNLPEPVVRYRIHGSQASTRDFAKTARAVSAALAAARMRAMGETDPLVAAVSLDSDLLDRLGVRPEEIAAHEVRYALWLASTLAAGGRHDGAGALWSLCMRRAGATADPRRTRARVLRARADACHHRRRRLRAVALRALAAAFDPRGAIAGLRGTSAPERQGC